MHSGKFFFHLLQFKVSLAEPPAESGELKLNKTQQSQGRTPVISSELRPLLVLRLSVAVAWRPAGFAGGRTNWERAQLRFLPELRNRNPGFMSSAVPGFDLCLYEVRCVLVKLRGTDVTVRWDLGSMTASVPTSPLNP